MVVVSEAFAQQSSKYFNVHWGKVYPIFDGASSISQLNDSSYFISNNTLDTQPVTNVKRITIFNKSGNLYSQQTDSDYAFVRGITMKMEPNYSHSRFYIGTGLLKYDSTGVGTSVPYIYVFDTLGHFLQPFIIGDTSNIQTGGVSSIAFSKNKSLLCTGVITTTLAGVNRMLPSYWKVDTLGNTIWEKRDSTSGCCVNRFLAIKEDSADNFIMLGTYKLQANASAAERLWLRKIDTNGNTLWDYKYDEPDIDSTFNYAVLQGRSLAIGNDGNYIVGGDYKATLLTNTSGRPSALIKFSAVDGHIIWRFNMVTIDTNYTYANAIEKIVPIPGEGYVLFGSLFDKRGDIAALLVK